MSWRIVLPSTISLKFVALRGPPSHKRCNRKLTEPQGPQQQDHLRRSPKEARRAKTTDKQPNATTSRRREPAGSRSRPSNRDAELQLEDAHKATCCCTYHGEKSWVHVFERENLLRNLARCLGVIDGRSASLNLIRRCHKIWYRTVCISRQVS